MFVQVLDIEREEKSDLPCGTEIDEYFDNTVINDFLKKKSIFSRFVSRGARSKEHFSIKTLLVWLLFNIKLWNSQYLLEISQGFQI